jgi:hypothetical protein
MDRWTDGLIDEKWNDRQADAQLVGRTHGWTGEYRDRRFDKKIDRRTDREGDRQTNRQRDRQACKLRFLHSLKHQI